MMRRVSALIGAAVVAALIPLAAVRTAERDTRIVAAARQQDAPAIRALIAQKVDVNAADVDGSTAILWAAYHNSLGIVRALIAVGADVNAANRYGLTPLLQASRSGATAVVEALLVAGARVEASTRDGETPLLAAAGAGDARAVSLLLARGAKVNARESAQNETALMWAADGGHADVIRALVAAGGDPNLIARTSELPRTITGDAAGRMWTDHASGGLTASMFAARQGYIAAIEALADAHADLNRENPDHITAMMLAVINDHLDAADALLRRGASTDDGSLYEAVVLHNLRTNETAGEATRPRASHANAVAPLDFIAHTLDRGADPNRLATHIIHYDGTGGGGAGPATAIAESPFARALRTQDVGAIRLMLRKGARVKASGGALPLAMAMGVGGGRGFSGGFGATPGAFRFAAERGTEPAVRLLLDAGADVNAADDNGDTIIHSAAQTGNAAMLRLFAARGARLDVADKAGLTPLDLAMGKQLPQGGGRGARGGGGGGQGRGGPPGPQPQAVAVLRELLGLPPLSPEDMQKLAPRGRGPQ